MVLLVAIACLTIPVTSRAISGRGVVVVRTADCACVAVCEAPVWRLAGIATIVVGTVAALTGEVAG